MRICFDLTKAFFLLLTGLELRSTVFTDDGSCSALESKSICMNEDILESIDNNDPSGRSKLKECIKNSHPYNGKNVWRQSHVTDPRENGGTNKRKLRRRFKGSKRMKKIRKKKQRWKRHKQKMR